MLARLTGHLESLSVENPPRVIIAPLGVGEGMGYEVLLPAYLAQRLLAESGAGELGGMGVGPVVTLYTLNYLESLNQGTSFIPRLIGFDSPRELAFFELLTSVKGLGNKRALRALATSPGAVARAIVERDARFLQGLPEIGPKLADLIVHELKVKAEAFTDLSGGRVRPAVSTPPTGAGAGGAGGADVAPTRVKPKLAAKADADQKPAIVEPRSAPVAPAAAPIRETINALIALGESPVDAERMVARAMDRARSGSVDVPTDAGALLSLAYASRGG